jgi:hypothetical protein
MHLHACRERPNEVPHPMTHLEFKNALCKALLLKWPQRKEVNNAALIHNPNIYMPLHSTLRRPCIVCRIHLQATYVLLSVQFPVYVLERGMLSMPS